MNETLIIFGTSEGQTEKISNFIATILAPMGHSVTIVNSRHIPPNFNPRVFDAILVGASIHASGYQNSLQSWVKSHADLLRKRPSAFFSVCLGVLQNEQKVQSDIRKITNDFFQITSWHPKKWTFFAGALAYTKYNWFIRRIMKNIAEKAGGNVDTTRNYEYTNWGHVKQFALEFHEFTIRQKSNNTLSFMAPYAFDLKSDAIPLQGSQLDAHMSWSSNCN